MIMNYAPTFLLFAVIIAGSYALGCWSSDYRVAPKGGANEGAKGGAETETKFTAKSKMTTTAGDVDCQACVYYHLYLPDDPVMQTLIRGCAPVKCGQRTPDGQYLPPVGRTDRITEAVDGEKQTLTAYCCETHLCNEHLPNDTAE